MDFQTYLIFGVTTAFIIFSPGPTAVLIASQSASNGFARAMIGLLGVTTATLIYFVLSATGIASLIVTSHTLFQIIKWAGVAYLIYLGCTALFSKSGGLIVKAGKASRSAKSLYSHGFLVEFSNPKALLYFSAILPQFLDISRPIAVQFAIMWATTLILQLGIYAGYAYLGAMLTKGGIKDGVVALINKSAGLALLFAGVKMAQVNAKI